jgi:hypothetical protein
MRATVARYRGLVLVNGLTWGLRPRLYAVARYRGLRCRILTTNNGLSRTTDYGPLLVGFNPCEYSIINRDVLSDIFNHKHNSELR